MPAERDDHSQPRAKPPVSRVQADVAHCSTGEALMIQLTYISTAVQPPGTEDLMDILRASREHNAGLGVTGMLLYSNGTFVQALEGERDAVDKLLNIIRHDPRHADLHILERKEIERRQYAEWSMGFKRLENEDFQGVPGLNQFFEADFSAANLSDKMPLIHMILAHFRNVEQKRGMANAKFAAFFKAPRTTGDSKP
jgi:hypothetical protein